jgi:hypothetical protein
VLLYVSQQKAHRIAITQLENKSVLLEYTFRLCVWRVREEFVFIYEQTHFQFQKKKKRASISSCSTKALAGFGKYTKCCKTQQRPRITQRHWSLRDSFILTNKGNPLPIGLEWALDSLALNAKRINFGQ